MVRLTRWPGTGCPEPSRLTMKACRASAWPWPSTTLSSTVTSTYAAGAGGPEEAQGFTHDTLTARPRLCPPGKRNRNSSRSTLTRRNSP
jgi:hypothetical protein